MFNRTSRLRLRRQLRKSRRQVEDMGSQAEEQLERHFFRRLNRLVGVRRFVFGWVFLLLLLIGVTVIQTTALNQHYQTLRPIAGGSFTEGIVGSFTNANPIYASGAVDSAASRLVFAGLLKYDQKNNLVGDLAQSYALDERGVVYTVTLRDRLFWHDGKPLSAADVEFTYRTIQNPDAKSPLFSSWQGIKVEAINPRTVQFTLPNALSAFPHSLVTGIVPKHLLATVPVTELRSDRFNTTNPIGAGPFKWEAIEVSGGTAETREEQIGLLPNSRYHFGEPRLQHFVIRAFRDENRMLSSFDKQELSAIGSIDMLPDNMKNQSNIVEHSIPLTGEVMVFFKNSHEILQDIKVRQALTQAVNQADVIKSLGYPVIVARSPLLPSQVGYDKTLVQLGYDPAAANKLLDEAGWVRGNNGIRTKAGKPLTFRLYSQSTSEYAAVAPKLQKNWREVGADVQVILQPDSDLQSTVFQHDYDALLYGISIGVDPDVFPYWHSTQADPRLQTRPNLSEYRSVVADKSLEAGRTRADPQIRAIKYQPFLQAWRTDAPAVALYQPRYLYVSRGNIFNFQPTYLNTGADRYANIQNWMIREEKTSQ